MSYIVQVFGVRGGETLPPIILSGISLLDVNDAVDEVIAEHSLDSIDTVLIVKESDEFGGT